MIDDETLIAYVDGELDAADAARVEAALDGDSALAERMEQQLRLKSQMAAAFDPILAEPVPDRIASAARRSADIVSIGSTPSRVRSAQRSAWWKQVSAIAASLAAGLVGGLTLSGGQSIALASKDDGVVAAGALRAGLDTQLAGAPGELRVQFSFRDDRGRICRTFAWAASDGVACRDRGGWEVQGLVHREDESSGSDYRMARGPSPTLMTLASGMMAGEPLTLEQEKAALAANWR